MSRLSLVWLFFLVLFYWFITFFSGIAFLYKVNILSLMMDKSMLAPSFSRSLYPPSWQANTLRIFPACRRPRTKEPASGKHSHPYDTPNKLIKFSKAASSKCKDYNQWVHFYEEDYEFFRLWRNPERYLKRLKRFNGVILPDFSL